MAGGSCSILCSNSHLILQIVKELPKRAILARHIESSSKQNKVKIANKLLLLPRYYYSVFLLVE